MRRVTAAGRPRPSQAAVDRHLRQVLDISDGTSVEMHLASLTPDELGDAIERVAQPILDRADHASQKGTTANAEA